MPETTPLRSGTMRFNPRDSVQAAQYNLKKLEEAKKSGKQVIYKLHKREGVVEVKVAKHRSPIRWMVNTFGRKQEKKLLRESFVQNTPLQKRQVSVDSENATSFMGNTSRSEFSGSTPPPTEPVLESNYIDLLSLEEEVGALPAPLSPEPVHTSTIQLGEDDDFTDSQNHILDGTPASLLKEEKESTPQHFDEILWSVHKQPLEETGKLVASALGLDEDKLPEWQASDMASPVGYPVNPAFVSRDKKAQLGKLFAMEKEASKLRAKIPNISPADTQEYLKAYVTAGLYASELPVDFTKGGFALAADLKAGFIEKMPMEYQQTLNRAAISALHETYDSETELSTLLQERLTLGTPNPIQKIAAGALRHRANDTSGVIDPRDRMTVADYNLLSIPAFGAEDGTSEWMQEAMGQDLAGVKLRLEMEDLKGYLSELNTKKNAVRHA